MKEFNKFQKLKNFSRPAICTEKSTEKNLLLGVRQNNPCLCHRSFYGGLIRSLSLSPCRRDSRRLTPSEMPPTIWRGQNIFVIRWCGGELPSSQVSFVHFSARRGRQVKCHVDKRDLAKRRCWNTRKRGWKEREGEEEWGRLQACPHDRFQFPFRQINRKWQATHGPHTRHMEIFRDTCHRPLPLPPPSSSSSSLTYRSKHLLSIN